MICPPSFVIFFKLMDLSENENVLNVNEIVIEEDVKRSKENANFQTQNNRTKGDEGKNMQTILQIYVFIGKHGKGIIKTHYVRHSIVLMMEKMLMG